MQAIENWAEVTGTVRDARPHERDDHLVVELVVDDVEPVAGYPNLFAHDKGRPLNVTLERSAVDGAQVTTGASVRWRVQKVAPGSAVAAPSSLEKGAGRPSPLS